MVSGFHLWWPRNPTCQAFRAVTWFHGGLAGRAWDFNWHNVIGLWSAVPLFVVVLSGVVISYRWAGDRVCRVAGEAPPPPAEGPGGAAGGSRGGSRAREGARDGASPLAGLDPLLARAERQVPGWRILTVNVPREGGGGARRVAARRRAPEAVVAEGGAEPA